ncbi:MAG: holo-ACP synthase [Bacteroidetes bacterium]|nr:holo-ACP synthase [Bacteroidota bacterium]MCH8941562.1 holo-ACP synthase [Bacteroidota bacterium]
MVIGIGIDIIEIDRIKESVEKYGDSFLNKIYTKTELDYCLNKSNKYQHLAARFAAKEAVYKALTTGTQEKAGWQNIEILNKTNGMPIVKLKGYLENYLTNGNSLKISISHSNKYVTCFAIVYRDAE